MIGIPVLDHLVLGDGYSSFRERGHRAFLKSPPLRATAEEKMASSSTTQWHVVETKQGPVGLVSKGEFLLRVFLPDGTQAGLHRQREKEFPDADKHPVPPFLREVEALLADYFAGAPVDPSKARIPFAFEGLTPFVRKVYEQLREVPRGTSVSYGTLAQLCGSPGAARAVGNAMARNPFPLLVPCHRVLAGGRRLGSFGGPIGPAQKESLLRLEGAWPPVREAECAP
jgi:methylated-DNA-[protein]-cysteine S-methyltransferase